MKKNIFKSARKIHKWLGYILAIQLLAWLVGGLIMSAIPLAKVHGKHLAQRSISNPFSQSHYLASLDHIAAQVSNPTHIKYGHFLNTPIIMVDNDNASYTFNGITGTPLPAPSKAQIIDHAAAHLNIDAQLRQIQHLSQAPAEAGNRSNVWQLQYDDMLNTTLYLDANSGQVITVRSHLWRLFDFVWMLHIMDYSDRENFNNPLLISFAASSVLFAFSGIILLIQSMRIRRVKRLKNK